MESWLLVFAGLVVFGLMHYISKLEKKNEELQTRLSRQYSITRRAIHQATGRWEDPSDPDWTEQGWTVERW